MDENKKSPECELEALRKLKKKVFLSVWAYWPKQANSPYREQWETAFSFVSYADLYDECEHFMDLADEQLAKSGDDSESFNEFTKSYFGV